MKKKLIYNKNYNAFLETMTSGFYGFSRNLNKAFSFEPTTFPLNSLLKLFLKFNINFRYIDFHLNEEYNIPDNFIWLQFKDKSVSNLVFKVFYHTQVNSKSLNSFIFDDGTVLISGFGTFKKSDFNEFVFKL